jgi:hypothetical protein
MLFGIFAALILANVILLAVVRVLMGAARRWLSAWVAIVIGAVTALFFVQHIVRGLIYCSQPSVFIQPPPGSDSEGRMIHFCDSAGGLPDRIYLYVLGPATVAILLYWVYSFWRTHLGKNRAATAS